MKETTSVTIQVGIWKVENGEQVLDVVWNSTEYASEFTKTWLEASKYTDYQLVVTINHERYGNMEWRTPLVGQSG